DEVSETDGARIEPDGIASRGDERNRPERSQPGKRAVSHWVSVKHRMSLRRAKEGRSADILVCSRRASSPGGGFGQKRLSCAETPAGRGRPSGAGGTPGGTPALLPFSNSAIHRRSHSALETPETRASA